MRVCFIVLVFRFLPTWCLRFYFIFLLCEKRVAEKTWDDSNIILVSYPLETSQTSLTSLPSYLLLSCPPSLLSFLLHGKLYLPPFLLTFSSFPVLHPSCPFFSMPNSTYFPSYVASLSLLPFLLHPQSHCPFPWTSLTSVSSSSEAWPTHSSRCLRREWIADSRVEIRKHTDISIRGSLSLILLILVS